MANNFFVNSFSLLPKKSKKILSIECGRAFFKIAYLKPEKQGFRLIDCLIKPLNFNKDTSQDLISVINSFLDKNSILTPQVYLTISDPDSVLIKQLELPSLPKREILGAVKWQLKEDLSFDLKDAIIDWQCIREFTDSEGLKKNEVIFAVAKAKAVAEYVALLNSSGLIPLNISVAPFNYSNILKYYPQDSKIQSILDIGHNSTTLYMYIGNKLKFIRKLPFSSKRLTEDLTGRLISDKGEVKLTPDQAEQIKQTFGIPKDQNQTLEGNIQAMQVISLFRPHLEILAKELKRTFDYFSSEFNQEIPHRLYLTGGGGNLKNLNSFLAKELSLEVLALSIPDIIDPGEVDKETLAGCRLQLLSALGAVLANSASINLIPKEIKAQNSELVQKISLRVSAIVVTALFFFSFLVVKLQLRDYRARLTNAKAHLETIGEIRILRQGILARDNLVSKLQMDRVPAGSLLKVLSELVPNEVILDRLILDQSKAVLSLQGQTPVGGEGAETVLAQFMQRIEDSAFFTEAYLVSSRQQGAIQNFEIGCDLSR